MSNIVLVCRSWCFSWMLDAVKPLFSSGWCSLFPVSVSSSCLKFLSLAHGNCFNLPKLLGYVLRLLHCHIYFPIFDFSSFSFLHMVALILFTTDLLFPGPFHFIQKVRSLPMFFFSLDGFAWRACSMIMKLWLRCWVKRYCSESSCKRKRKSNMIL